MSPATLQPLVGLQTELWSTFLNVFKHIESAFSFVRERDFVVDVERWKRLLYFLPLRWQIEKLVLRFCDKVIGMIYVKRNSRNLDKNFWSLNSTNPVYHRFSQIFHLPNPNDIGLNQCFSNIFIPSPPFLSRHVVFAPQAWKSKRKIVNLKNFI